MTDAPPPFRRTFDLHPAGGSGGAGPASPVTTLTARTIWTPDFEIDLGERCARYLDGEEVRFTPRQWQVLECLIKAIPRAVSRGRLADEVFGAGAGTDDLDHIAVVISQLRRKLEPEPGSPRYFPCIDSETYGFDPDGRGRHLLPRSARDGRGVPPQRTTGLSP